MLLLLVNVRRWGHTCNHLMGTRNISAANSRQKKTGRNVIHSGVFFLKPLTSERDFTLWCCRCNNECYYCNDITLSHRMRAVGAYITSSRTHWGEEHTLSASVALPLLAISHVHSLPRYGRVLARRQTPSSCEWLWGLEELQPSGENKGNNTLRK